MNKADTQLSRRKKVNDKLTETAPPEKLRLEGEVDHWEANYNMRNWVQEALEAKGAEITGAGFGACQSDLDIELEGMRYNIQIKPRGFVLNEPKTIRP